MAIKKSIIHSCLNTLFVVEQKGVFIFYLAEFTPLTYLDYHYPWWGHFIGLLLALSSMICVPVYMVYVVWRQEGTLMEVWIEMDEL